MQTRTETCPTSTRSGAAPGLLRVRALFPNRGPFKRRDPLLARTKLLDARTGRFRARTCSNHGPLAVRCRPEQPTDAYGLRHGQRNEKAAQHQAYSLRQFYGRPSPPPASAQPGCPTVSPLDQMRVKRFHRIIENP